MDRSPLYAPTTLATVLTIVLSVACSDDTAEPTTDDGTTTATTTTAAPTTTQTGPDQPSTAGSTSDPVTSISTTASGDTTVDPTGADCLDGDVKPCYSGPNGTVDVGVCKQGTSTCVDGEFSACIGEILPSFDQCATADDEDCDGVDAACSGDPLWGHNVGGYIYDFVYDAAWTADGAVYAVGTTNAYDADFGGEIVDSSVKGQAFVARYASDGKLAWVKMLGIIDDAGLTNDAKILSVGVDSQGRAVFFGTITKPGSLGSLGPVVPGTFVGRYASDGTLDWIKHFPATTVIDARMAIFDNDRIALHGAFKGTQLDLGGGAVPAPFAANLFVAVLNSDGTHVKSRVIGDTNYPEPHPIARDPSGGFVIAGSYMTTLQLGEGPPADPDLDTNPEEWATYVVRFDAAAAVTDHWEYNKTIPVAVRPMNGGDVVLVTRAWNDPVDFGDGPLDCSTCSVRLGLDGLQASWWGSHELGASVAAIAPSGAVIVSSVTDSLMQLPGEQVPPPNARKRVYITKIDPAVGVLWTQVGYTDPNWTGVVGPLFLATSAEERIAVGGWYYPQLTFGSIDMMSSKADHGWIVALAQ